VALLLAAAAALTAVLVLRTFWYLFHSVTNAPYTDGWVIFDEIRRFREGALHWTFFWAPYWGQRNLVARLLFFFSAKYLSFSALPLIAINVAAWLSMLAVLIRTARRLFPESRLVFFACSIALVHLVLSSLGMEVLVITQNVQHSVGYASAVSAILLFNRRPWLGIALAVLATASVAIGLLVWPILLVQAWRSGATAKLLADARGSDQSHDRKGVVSPGPMTLAALLAITAAMFALYAIGYTRPPSLGIGVGGALRHPGVALSMTSLVLGGPVTLYSLRLGTAAGGVGLGALLWFLIRRSGNQAGFALTMAACFLAASAASLAVGRISPEWLASLHGAQPLPSRYIAPTLVFWGCLFVLAMGQRDLLPRFAVCALVLVMTFGTWSWQWRVSREWAVAFQKSDAIAAGFLSSVSDPELMSLLLTDGSLRDRTVDYMRRERLAVFAEPRAAWIGRRIDPAPPICRGSFSTVALANGMRVTGSLERAGLPASNSFDLLITGDTGTVSGLARSLPAQSEGRGAIDFLGYARAGAPASLRLFVARDGRPVCQARP